MKINDEPLKKLWSDQELFLVQLWEFYSRYENEKGSYQVRKVFKTYFFIFIFTEKVFRLIMTLCTQSYHYYDNS